MLKKYKERKKNKNIEDSVVYILTRRFPANSLAIVGIILNLALYISIGILIKEKYSDFGGYIYLFLYGYFFGSIIVSLFILPIPYLISKAAHARLVGEDTWIKKINNLFYKIDTLFFTLFIILLIAAFLFFIGLITFLYITK